MFAFLVARDQASMPGSLAHQRDLVDRPTSPPAHATQATLTLMATSALRAQSRPTNLPLAQLRAHLVLSDSYTVSLSAGRWQPPGHADFQQVGNWHVDFQDLERVNTRPANREHSQLRVVMHDPRGNAVLTVFNVSRVQFVGDSNITHFLRLYQNGLGPETLVSDHVSVQVTRSRHNPSKKLVCANPDTLE